MISQLFFFFSSRRRHTRSLRDWSSDVCSSDLHGPTLGRMARYFDVHPQDPQPRAIAQVVDLLRGGGLVEIGRASCRERVEISVVVGSLKKKSWGEVEAYAVHTTRSLSLTLLIV